MANSPLPLVQGDSRPRLLYQITDKLTGAPVDISGAAVTLNLQTPGSAQGTYIASLVGVLMVGMYDDDGNLVITPPYDVPGAGGLCYFDLIAPSLSVAGQMVGDCVIDFADGSQQTLYSPQKFTVRASL